MTREADGIQWTPQLLLFVQSYVLTGDTEKALADAQLPETFKVDEFLQHPEVASKVSELNEAALNVAMENENTIIARAINWAKTDIADYFHFPESTAGPEYTNVSRIEVKNIENMPRTMRQRIKSIKVKPVHFQGMIITHTVELELHDPMKANAEVARLKKVGEEVSYSARERAQMLHEFLLELEDIHNVRDGEFPPDDEEGI